MTVQSDAPDGADAPADAGQQPPAQPAPADAGQQPPAQPAPPAQASPRQTRQQPSDDGDRRPDGRRLDLDAITQDAIERRDRALKRAQDAEAKLEELTGQSQTLASKVESLERELRNRDIMDVLRPELQDGVSSLLAEATLDKLEAKGVVDLKDVKDAKEMGKRYLAAVQEHVPELLRDNAPTPGGRQPGAAPPTNPATPPRYSRDQLQVGSRVQQILARSRG